MRKSRRQIVNRIVEITGVGLVALDLVVFLAIYRQLGEKVAAETRRHGELRQAIRNEQVRVDLLDKYETTFPETGKAMQDFTTHRAPPRREAYSTADHLVHKLADASGIKLSTIGFRREKEQKEPLQRLALEVNAQGPYPGLIKFSHALETADEFILVRDFTIAPAGENGALALRLGLDLFLTP